MKTPLLIAIFLTAAWCQDSTIELNSPRDYQVFQRKTRDGGTLLFAGRAAGADTVEARVRNGWTRLVFDSASGLFHGEVPAQSGGFFVVDVRSLKSGKPLAQTTVAHVGVGEVFVIAGQSNATNYGEVRQETHTGMVVSFSGTTWAIANDPQPGVQDNSSKGSFVPAFGDAMYQRFHVPIGVACVGHGSTSVRQWLPKGDSVEVLPTMTKYIVEDPAGKLVSDGRLFDGLMKRVRELGPRGFRAILWHQGESDAHQKPEHAITAATYARMMTRLIEAVRAEAGWNISWFVAQASYHTPEDPSTPAIRDAQSALWRNGIALEGPDTDTLTGKLRQNNGQGVHFSVEGLQAHGRLWAEKVAAWLDTQL
jgi:Carbohydrate esterase, sialic acid-specific acetylesterase